MFLEVLELIAFETNFIGRTFRHQWRFLPNNQEQSSSCWCRMVVKLRQDKRSISCKLVRVLQVKESFLIFPLDHLFLLVFWDGSEFTLLSVVFFDKHFVLFVISRTVHFLLPWKRCESADVKFALWFSKIYSFDSPDFSVWWTVLLF